MRIVARSMGKSGQSKLLHWFASMLSLMLISVALAGHYWFVVLPDRAEYIGQEVWQYLPPLGGLLMTFAVGFGPLVVWHLGDLLQGGQPRRSILKILGNYGLLYGWLLVWGLVALLGQSEFLNDLGCPPVEQGPATFTFDGCGSFTPAWKQALFLFVSLVICVICLAKLIIGVVSRIRKSA